jgi:surfeit locus 1 family protein
MIRLQIGKYLFAPKPIPLITTIILVPVFISLGLWQLDRAEQKREVDSSVREAQSKSPLKLNIFNGNDFSREVYRGASLFGAYDSQHQYLLDNRTHKGIAGYHVLTPFILKGSDGNTYDNRVVLVNRGWITYQGSRKNIPDINIEEKSINISGVIKEQGRAIVLGDNVQSENDQSGNKSYPRLIQSIQLDELAKELKVELLPIVIELEKSDKTGFIRDWQPYYGSIDKHNAYALQWFVMAGILLFLFIKLNTKKIKL